MLLDELDVGPCPPTADVEAFGYSNDVGLRAVIFTCEMKQFVEKLSEHLSKQ
jgi:hypothetical protein